MALAVASLGGGALIKRRVPALLQYAPAPHIQPEEEALPEPSEGAEEKSDLLIISTVDGYLHGIAADRSGKRTKMWSLSSGGPMMTSMKRGDDDSIDYSVLPAADGTLLVHHQDSNGLRKTSVTARMLAEKTPFVNDDGLVFSGVRRSRLMGVDINSGSIFHQSDSLSEDPSQPGRPMPLGDSPEDELRPEDFSPPAALGSNARPLWIGRTDYTVRAFHSDSGIEAFNLSYSEVRPLGPMQRRSDLRPGRLIDGPGKPRADRDSMVISSLSGEVLLADTALSSEGESLVLSELSLGSPAASAFSVSEGADGGLPTFRAHRVVHQSTPLAASLAESSALVASDVRALLLRSSGELEKQLVVQDARRSSSLREQLFRLTGMSVVSSSARRASVKSLHQLVLSTDQRLSAGDYRLLPAAPDDHDDGRLVDPVLGDFSLSSGYDYFKASAGEAEGKLARRESSERESSFATLAEDALRAIETLLLAVLLLVVLLYASALALKRLGVRLPAQLERVDTVYRNALRFLGLDVSAQLSEDFAKDLETADTRAAQDGNQVGSLLLSSDVLGYGSHGTVVYKGSLNGRPVAIKRMLAQFNKAANREISLLIRSDGHANVVRYFLSEQKGEFIYLALQLCHMSLKDFVTRLQRSQLSRPPEERRLLRVPDEARVALQHIALGLNHLHSNRIVHRDIKPHNILLEQRAIDSDEVLNEETSFGLRHLGHYTLKISDMGLSKQLDKDGSSFASMSMSVQTGLPSTTLHSQTAQQPQVVNPVGTIGWQAPELMALRNQGLSSPTEEEGSETLSLDEDEEGSGSASPTLSSHRRTQRVDIFSLGCVYFYVLVPGEHPFGQWFEREANIMAGKADLDRLSGVQEAADLIARMLDKRPEARPSARQLCRHPFFWTAQRRLDFLVELSDLLEHEQADAPIVIAVETNAAAVVGRNWDRRLDQALLEDMGKYRKYDTCSVRDCLRVIRNKRNHFNELTTAMREIMAPMPSGFLGYFETKFPKLFMHCVKVACRFLSDDKKFREYCSTIAPLYSACPKQKSSDETDSSAVARANSSLVNTNGRDDRDDDSASTPKDEVRTHHQLALTESSDDRPGGLQFDGIVVWRGSALAEACGSHRGWMRDDVWWVNGRAPVRSKGRPAHLTRSSTDFRYRSRLCTHWELHRGTTCPMRKKGKCDFAHGPLELRVKDNRRERWGHARARELHEGDELRYSGGEDVLGAARSIERVRVKEGSISEFERSSGNFKRLSGDPG